MDNHTNVKELKALIRGQTNSINRLIQRFHMATTTQEKKQLHRFILIEIDYLRRLHDNLTPIRANAIGDVFAATPQTPSKKRKSNSK